MELLSSKVLHFSWFRKLILNCIFIDFEHYSTVQLVIFSLILIAILQVINATLKIFAVGVYQIFIIHDSLIFDAFYRSEPVVAAWNQFFKPKHRKLFAFWDFELFNLKFVRWLLLNWVIADYLFPRLFKFTIHYKN